MTALPILSTEPGTDIASIRQPPLTVSIEEAAAMLGVSVATVRRLVQRRLLRILPGLRHKRVVCASLQEFARGEFVE